MAKPIRIEADIIHRRDNGDKVMRTDNFTSGSLGEGWQLKGDSTNGLSYLEIDNLLVRNTLRTHIFQKDIIKATNGQLYISDSGIMSFLKDGSDDPIIPTAATGTIYFKVDTDPASASFEIDAELIVKDADPITGSITTTTFTIDSVGTTANGLTPYGYKDGVNMDALREGVTAVRISGGTVLIDASTSDAPFIDVKVGTTTKARFGNLEGKVIGGGYGLWSENVFLTGVITANEGHIGGSDGWAIATNTITGGDIVLDATDGAENITIGSNIVLNGSGTSTDRKSVV